MPASVCRLVNTNITVLLCNPGIAATSLNLFMPGPINQLYGALSKGWTLTVPQVCQSSDVLQLLPVTSKGLHVQ